MSVTSIETYLSTRASYARMYLTTPTALTLTTVGEYYTLTSNLADGNTQNFTLLNGVLTFTKAGVTNLPFKFDGSADASVDKSSRVIFDLFKNADAQVAATTTVDFTNTTKTKGFASCDIVLLSTGDTIRVKAKTDTDTTVLTLADFRIILWGL